MGIVHGDCFPDNTLFNDNKLIAIIDFEDFGISVGENYHISTNSDIIFWFGYEQKKQFLKINDGTQTIGSADLTGLDSSYDSTWKGLNVGLEHSFKYSHFKIKTNLFYHWMKYEAKANWNLSSSFQKPLSFEHEVNNATGLSYGLAIEYKLSKSTTLFTAYDKIDYTGKDGSNKQYLSDGSIGGSVLNEVNWESDKIAFGVTIKF
mgnify:CR=1 FL=1